MTLRRRGLTHVVWMTLFHEETKQMFETSQQIDTLCEVIVSDLENEGLSMAVHAEYILE